MRHLIYIYACATALLLLSCSGGKDDEPVVAETVDTIPMMVQMVQQCSRLYTAEYRVHKVVIHDDAISLQGRALGKDFSLRLPAGRRKVAIPVDATLKAYVDMGAVTEQDIRRNGDKIEIVLPKPHVVMTSSSIDHDGIKQYVAVLRSNFSDEELSGYESQGRKAIIADIPRLGILEMAKAGAARQLIPLIAQMGFRQEDVTVTFIEDDKKGGIAWVLD